MCADEGRRKVKNINSFFNNNLLYSERTAWRYFIFVCTRRWHGKVKYFIGQFILWTIHWIFNIITIVEVIILVKYYIPIKLVLYYNFSLNSVLTHPATCLKLSGNCPSKSRSTRHCPSITLLSHFETTPFGSLQLQ